MAFTGWIGSFTPALMATGLPTSGVLVRIVCA